MDENNDRSIVDTVEGILELYEENEDKIKDVLGGGGKSIDAIDPLTEVHVEDDEVVIIAEGVDTAKGYSMVSTDDGVKFNIGDEVIEARLPDDTSIEDADVELINGVLNVTFSRGE